jgi:hypothetical protein
MDCWQLHQLMVELLQTLFTPIAISRKVCDYATAFVICRSAAICSNRTGSIIALNVASTAAAIGESAFSCGGKKSKQGFDSLQQQVLAKSSAVSSANTAAENLCSASLSATANKIAFKHN